MIQSIDFSLSKSCRGSVQNSPLSVVKHDFNLPLSFANDITKLVIYQQRDNGCCNKGTTSLGKEHDDMVHACWMLLATENGGGQFLPRNCWLVTDLDLDIPWYSDTTWMLGSILGTALSLAVDSFL